MSPGSSDVTIALLGNELRHLDNREEKHHGECDKRFIAHSSQIEIAQRDIEAEKLWRAKMIGWVSGAAFTGGIAASLVMEFIKQRMHG